jgi:hypothetical protein
MQILAWPTELLHTTDESIELFLARLTRHGQYSITIVQKTRDGDHPRLCLKSITIKRPTISQTI